jgi:hypothetical protein
MHPPFARFALKMVTAMYIETLEQVHPKMLTPDSRTYISGM